jgi:hypothetical protein
MRDDSRRNSSPYDTTQQQPQQYNHEGMMGRYTPPYGHSHHQEMMMSESYDDEEYSVAQQDLANVHFRFEEEEEYLMLDYCQSMDDENPFFTPPQHPSFFIPHTMVPHHPAYSPHLSQHSNPTPNYYSPRHSFSSSNGSQSSSGKLRRSFGMDDLVHQAPPPVYFYKPKL